MAEENHKTADDGVKIRKAPRESAQNTANKRKESDKNSGKAASATKKEKRKKKKRKRSRLPGVLILTTFIFAVSISLAMVIIAYGKDMLGIGKGENTQIIEIPESATTEEIAQILNDKGIIKSPKFFVIFSQLNGADSKFLPGEYFISPNMAYETIIQKLTTVENEKKESVEVTFPEGMTLYDAAALLEENGVCTADDFIFFFNAGGFGFDFEDRLNSTSSLKFYRMEGYLFPDTYYFYEEMDPEEVCQKIYMNFDQKMNSEAEIAGKTYSTRYERMNELNLTLDQLVTFASIVQKEASSTDSMKMVASVFWNRLNNSDKFPLLQSDPTRLYSENVIKPHMEVYDQAMIDAYNTYVGAGLPPGAICNPGTDAIDAVLENYSSDYFYFIANTQTGETFYSKTIEEHNAYQQQIQEANGNGADAAG